MQLTEFTSLFMSKYPAGRVVARNADYGGATRLSGIALAFSPDGKIFEYSGPFVKIAERLKLLPVFAVLRGGERVSSFNTLSAAQADCDARTSDEKFSAAQWGYTPRVYSVKQQ